MLLVTVFEATSVFRPPPRTTSPHTNPVGTNPRGPNPALSRCVVGAGGAGGQALHAELLGQ